MKKVLLFTAILFMANLYSQETANDRLTIKKGTLNLAGDFSLGINNSETRFESFDQEFQRDSDRTSVSIFPRFGYAFADNWLVGLIAGYGVSKIENNDIELGAESNFFEAKTETVTIAPYARRYFGLNKNLAIYLQGELGLNWSWNENTGDTIERTTSNVDEYFVAFRPGISFFVSKGLAFESSIGALRYSSFDSENGQGNQTESTNLDFSLNASDLLFGLSYYF
nr:autotransporter domain-containing protein [Allomuricauda sp.]